MRETYHRYLEEKGELGNQWWEMIRVGQANTVSRGEMVG